MKKKKRSYVEALKAAEALKVQLRSACFELWIAGSLRRRSPEVGDIELVAIPRKKRVEDLFGVKEGEETMLDFALEKIGFELQKNGPRMKQFLYQDFQVDLFVTDIRRFAVIYFIRTGSADYVKWAVTSRADGGGRRPDRFVKDGYVWVMGKRNPLLVLDEGQVFQVLGIPWLPPEKRTHGFWGEEVVYG